MTLIKRRPLTKRLKYISSVTPFVLFLKNAPHPLSETSGLYEVTSTFYCEDKVLS